MVRKRSEVRILVTAPEPNEDFSAKYMDLWGHPMALDRYFGIDRAAGSIFLHLDRIFQGCSGSMMRNMLEPSYYSNMETLCPNSPTGRGA
jgi:hypothetical protein